MPAVTMLEQGDGKDPPSPPPVMAKAAAAGSAIPDLAAKSVTIGVRQMDGIAPAASHLLSVLEGLLSAGCPAGLVLAQWLSLRLQALSAVVVSAVGLLGVLQQHQLLPAALAKAGRQEHCLTQHLHCCSGVMHSSAGTIALAQSPPISRCSARRPASVSRARMDCKPSSSVACCAVCLGRALWGLRWRTCCP